MYECAQDKPVAAHMRKYVQYVEECISFCKEYSSHVPYSPCEFYTIGTGVGGSTHPMGECTLYKECNRKEYCPDCASGSMLDCLPG